MHSDRKSDIVIFMDWPKIIQSLLDTGMTQVQLAEACDTGQSHISGLLRGERKQPGWSLGNRLLKLYDDRCERDAA